MMPDFHEYAQSSTKTNSYDIFFLFQDTTRLSLLAHGPCSRTKQLFSLVATCFSANYRGYDGRW